MLNKKIIIVIKMEHHPDEIIVRIINQLGIQDILNTRLLNLQFYKCSFSCEPFIAKIVELFQHCDTCCRVLHADVFKIAQKIPTFDFTINDNYAIKWAYEFGFIQHVKFLVDRGVNIHVDNECALQRASQRGASLIRVQRTRIRRRCE